MRRARLGLSQQDLAERMRTTASVISRIEPASTAPAPKP
jgi:ribosome-binding protein aMBF1 (putative translation factor)